MANEKLENPLSSCLCTISSNFYSIQFTIIAFFPKLERNSVDTAKLSRYSFSTAHTGRMSCRYQVTIEKEAFFTVRQCLVAPPGTRKENIVRVISDVSSLDQCDDFLQSMPGVRKEAAADPAQAAQAVASSTERYKICPPALYRGNSLPSLPSPSISSPSSPFLLPPLHDIKEHA